MLYTTGGKVFGYTWIPHITKNFAQFQIYKESYIF